MRPLVRALLSFSLVMAPASGLAQTHAGDGDPRARSAAPMIFPTFERDHDAIALRRSALRWADSLRIPLLILHGEADPQVSPRQSLRLALALDAKKTPYEVHVVAGGSHTLGERATVRDSMVIAWFTKYRQ